MEYFPRIVQSVDELPEPIGLAVRRVQPEPCIGYIVVIPPQQYAVPGRFWWLNLPYNWRHTPHRTLIFGDEQLTIIAAPPDGTLSTTVIP